MIKHKPKKDGKTCFQPSSFHLKTRTPGLYSFERQPGSGPHANESSLRTSALRLDKRHPYLGIVQTKSIAGFKQNKAPPSC